MSMWHYLLRLVFNRATLIRVLTDRALEQLVGYLSSHAFGHILLAGGSRHAPSSELVVLKSKICRQAEKVVAVNISLSHKPDVLADLIRPWPFKDMSFDCVIATWVLEHLSDPVSFFAEAYRVLKSSGHLIVTVPFIHRIHGSPHDYWRFTDTALMELSKRAGFTNIRIIPVGGSPFLCAVSLLWPMLRLPVLSGSIALVAWLLDKILLWMARGFGKSSLLLNSYVIAYILLSSKPERL